MLLAAGKSTAADSKLHIDTDFSSKDLRPVYPTDFNCGRITSLFGSFVDLDGSRRDHRHLGIDFGHFGDVLVSPADATILAIWEVTNDWGRDWNILLAHTADDLNLPNSKWAYYTEFDHLRFTDIAHLKTGTGLRRGDIIGVVRRPGGNSRFRAETHMELFRVPTQHKDNIIWQNENSFVYWVNYSAETFNPLAMMAQKPDQLAARKVAVTGFKTGYDYHDFRGIIYPLICN